ncbi:MAG: siderophore-interacting protein [Candidatus Protistobacter heckmanni]|nr:siderophore-interacting protein [Candidatus Protistobacter heckmanni]
MTNNDQPYRVDLNVFRVRHTLKFRLLQVKRVHKVTPHLLRVTLGGEDLRDFESASFDDHVKLFFPAPGEDKHVIPTLGPDGPVYPEGRAKPLMRDFTPRRFDAEACELDIEFAMHEAGPATSWAAQAKPGQYLGVGGPRGSMIITKGFDWHLLVGDETALPAIARRLEELPAGVHAAVFVQGRDPSAHVAFETETRLQAQWIYRDQSADPERELLDALRQFDKPAGEGFVWASGEAAMVRAVRKFMVEERGVDKNRIRASAYWRRGAQAVHEVIED